MMDDIPGSKDDEHSVSARFGEAKYRVLFEIMDVPIIIEYQDALVECNDATLRLFGYTREQMLAVHPSKFSPEYQPNGRRSEEMAQELLAAVMAGQPQRVLWRHQRADGSEFDAEVTVKAFDFDGRRYRQAIVRDLTEQQAAQQALREAEMAAVAQRSEEEALRRSEAQFRNLVETTQDWFWETDPDGHFTYVSPRVQDLLGYTPQEILGKTPFDLMRPAEAKRVAAIIRRLVREREPLRLVENTLIARDGRALVHETSGIPFFDHDDRLQGYRGINRDISQRVEGQQRLRLAAQILEQTPEGVVVTDTRTRVLSVNQAFERTTGYSAAEILGMTPHLLASGRHDQAFYRRMWEEINSAGSWQGEIWNRRKNGDIYPEWLNITAIRDESGAVTHYAAIFSDISTQEHVRKRLHNLAYYDALTELPNRELFHDRLTNALITAARDRHSVALLFFDLDRFKNINDTLGHTVGDELLKAVAARLPEVMRGSDTAARLGGDEFTIILPTIHTPSEAGVVANKVLTAFQQHFHIAGHELFVTTSIGIALYPQDAADAELLLRNADTAMYRAKELGRNNYQFYDSHMSSRFAERIGLENDLRKAAENGEFSLMYQPQFDIDSQRIVGLEALLRWNHPSHGLVSPAQFVPIAEESGLILPLGIWVLEQSCAQALRWLAQGRRDFRVAVNVSAVQLRFPGFVDTVAQVLQRTGCHPHHLELELTESSLMENVEMAMETLTQLSKLGVALAIDDFGTGYSSLGYLKRLTLDKLKIDKSFIDDVLIDRSDAEITATIVMMAHNLGLRVIAEGVESDGQLAFLRQLGCDEVQGYLFSKPLPVEALAELWDRHDGAQ